MPSFPIIPPNSSAITPPPTNNSANSAVTIEKCENLINALQSLFFVILLLHTSLFIIVLLFLADLEALVALKWRKQQESSHFARCDPLPPSDSSRNRDYHHESDAACL